jgi:hypothetical protein
MADKWDERKKAIEEEYFLRKEKELIAKLKAKREKDDDQALQKLCHMRCPKCGQPLKERSFQKVMIDQCPGCGGIWLDAGELEEVAGREEAGWLGKLWRKVGQ